MKKLNRKGFTLIELLAVITIMGILMLVAIPAVSRTIENSRRDTFADVAKTYINTVRNSVLADELECGDDHVNVGATGAGKYYFLVDSDEQSTKDILESGGKSSWSNARVMGYVAWEKETVEVDEETHEQKTTSKYSIVLVDTAKHGIDTETDETAITRAKVKVEGSVQAGDDANIVPSGDPAPVECRLK